MVFCNPIYENELFFLSKPAFQQHRHRQPNTDLVFAQYKSLSDYLYIFVKDVIVNKVATYRLGACHFIRKCFDNLKKAAVQNPCNKLFALEPFLMKLQIYTLDF